MLSSVITWCCILTCNHHNSLRQYAILSLPWMLYSDLDQFKIIQLVCYLMSWLDAVFWLGNILIHLGCMWSIVKACSCILTGKYFNSPRLYVIFCHGLLLYFWLGTILIHIGCMWSSVMHWCYILTYNHLKSFSSYVILCHDLILYSDWEIFSFT